MISVNRGAAVIVERMVTQADSLGVEVSRLPNGAWLVDCGVMAPGGLEAGRYLAEACMGGLGHVSFLSLEFGDGNGTGFWLPGVGVAVDQPSVGCMASQYAGWAINRDKYFAMGSGPARALARGEKLFEQLGYCDHADRAVLVLETRQMPGEGIAEYIATKCGVPASGLTLLVAPTASLAGSVQISARVVETGLHKLMELGFDLRQVISGYGTAPMATIDKDDLHAIGRTNDCVLYGGQVYYTVRGDDAELAALIERVPSAASRDYGQPFYRIFKQYGGDFYAIDPLLFSPARVTINNIASGKTFVAGHVNATVLASSLLSA